MATLAGLPPRDAIEWVRTAYDGRAVETAAQEAWVEWFAANRPGPADPGAVP